MTTRAADRVDEWESRPFTDGYEQLRTLADRSFSGVVTAGRATLYLINGAAIDVIDGSIEDFEDATGTIREAPTPALPLLAVMQERGDEVRAKYYSEETALSDADRKLSDGGFTGYVELSENVLSGDYYVLYQAGKSMSVAFLGESERLVYGDDAFERADEEVGIYKVYPVSIDPIDIPEPKQPDTDADDQSGTDGEPTSEAAASDPTTDTAPEDGSPAVAGRSDETESAASASDAAEPTAVTDRAETSGDADSPQDERAQAQTAQEPDRRPEHSDRRTDRDPPSRESGPRRDRTPRDTDAPVTEHVDDVAPGSDDRDGDTALERRVIPSVDPDRTGTPADDHTGTDSEYEQPASRQANSESVSPSASDQSASTRSATDGQSARSGGTQSAIADLQRRIDELETERGALEDERDELQAQLTQIQEERDELREEVQTLREQVATLESQSTTSEPSPSGGDTPSGQSFTPQEAIAGTNLFVRYGSKSGATLSAAHDGDADATAVNDNLSLEYHTEFDDTTATVDGEPYESFLTETIHYQFVVWLVEEFLYEVRDTGHRSSLADLYDAIPRIDRVQFAGTVTADVDTEDDTRTDASFDVVVRDRMGNPLIVTNLNDSRSATTEEMMTDLVTSARRVGDAHERLAGAFFVTSSFFDPDALETAAEATGGGLLSRDKRESFVRLSRKDGFHLCLVESRDDDFHLSVPEL